MLVQPGTYLENINFEAKNILVTSLYHTTQDTTYISSTVIDGNQNGTVVLISDNETDQNSERTAYQGSMFQFLNRW